MANISATNSKTIYAPASSTYGYVLKVTFTETATSTPNNTSTISITASLYGKNIGYASTTANNMKIYWIDNNAYTTAHEVASKTIATQTQGSTTTLTGTITPTHKADGTLKGYARVVFTKGASNNYVPPTTTVNTANTTLTTIPRATNVPAATLTVGTTNSVTISPASTSFSHTATFTLGGRSFTANAAAGTSSLSFDLSDSTIYDLFSTASTNVTATLTTKNGSTTIGSKTGTWTIRCDPNVCKPTVSATYADTNTTTTALTGTNQKIVKGYSNASLTINPVSSTSTISKVTVDGTEAPNKTSYVINGVNTDSVVIVATDARGFQSDPYTLTFSSVVDYVPLTASATFERNTPTDGKVGLSLTGNYFNSSFGSTANTLTVTYQYKESTASSYGSAITITPTKSGNTYSYSVADLGRTFDYTKSYDFKLNVSDKLNSFSIEKSVTKGEPIFWVNDDKFKFKREVYLKSSTNSLDSVISSLTTAITNINNALYYKSGDSLTLTDFSTAGFLTSDKLLVSFTISIPKSMANVSISMTGFKAQLRNNNNYILGTGSAKAAPSRVTITKLGDHYARINITLASAASGATNNDACGINFDATINFS